MFSPASSGRVHILVTASRAELAWIVHIPGNPELSAISRSRHSCCRTSPTMIREGGMETSSGEVSRASSIGARAAWRPIPSLRRNER